MDFFFVLLYSVLIVLWAPKFPIPLAVMTFLSFYHSSPKDTLLTLVGVHLISAAIIFAVTLVLAVLVGAPLSIVAQVVVGYLLGRLLGILRYVIKI